MTSNALDTLEAAKENCFINHLKLSKLSQKAEFYAAEALWTRNRLMEP